MARRIRVIKVSLIVREVSKDLVRLIREADLNAYRDFGKLPDNGVYHYNDYDARNHGGDNSTVSTRSKSQYTKGSNSGTNQRYVARSQVNKDTGESSKVKQDEQLRDVLALYDKHFLEYNTSEVKLGKSKGHYKNVDFSRLNELDFETNKQKVEQFLAEIREEEESSYGTEIRRTPIKTRVQDDIQLI